MEEFALVGCERATEFSGDSGPGTLWPEHQEGAQVRPLTLTGVSTLLEGVDFVN